MSRFRPAGLTDEQALLADLVDELVADLVAPAADAVDERGEPDPRVVAALSRYGLLAVDLPGELGGGGADLRSAVLVVAGVARGSAALAALPAVSHAVGAARAAGDGPAADLLGAGDTDTALVAGASGSVELRPAGDGWRASGRIGRVEAPIEPRRLLMLIDSGSGPMACVLQAGAAGVEVGSADLRTGLRGSGTRAVLLDSALVGNGDVVGGEASVAAALQHRLLTTAARACGVARASVDAAAAYLKERRQFGVRLADMPGLRAMAAAAAVRLAAAEAAMWSVAGRPDALRPAGLGACAETAAMCVETAVQASTDALQLHGGYGYTRDFPVERLLRDALSLRASLGGTGAMLEIAATALMGPAQEYQTKS